MKSITINVKNKVAIYAILIAIILIPAIIGAVLLLKNQDAQGYVKINAQVVDYKQKREYDYDEMYEKFFYQEIVEYSVDGRTYSATSDVWTTAPKRIGGHIKLAYDPNNPSKCIFVANSNIGLIVCFGLSAVGVILLIVTAVGHIRGKSF